MSTEFDLKDTSCPIQVLSTSCYYKSRRVQEPQRYLKVWSPLDRNAIVEHRTIQACFELLLKDELESMVRFLLS